jgi:hypothetical protein
VVVKKPLHRLFRSLTEGMTVTASPDLTRRWDYQVSMMSLGYVCGTRVETIPGEVPYLAAEDALVARWRERLAGPGLKVGIRWQGSVGFSADRLRSVRLADFSPLAAISGVRLISLQSFDGLDQLKGLPKGMAIESLGDAIAHPDEEDGFAQIAAVMANLDLIVTVDTAIGHVAGALALPVWTAVRFQPEWRWLEERSDTPWYPTMRLFRQQATGDWRQVTNEMAAELRKLVEAQP